MNGKCYRCNIEGEGKVVMLGEKAEEFFCLKCLGQMKIKRFKVVTELEMANDTNFIKNLIDKIELELGFRVVTMNWEQLDK